MLPPATFLPSLSVVSSRGAGDTGLGSEERDSCETIFSNRLPALGPDALVVTISANSGSPFRSSWCYLKIDPPQARASAI